MVWCGLELHLETVTSISLGASRDLWKSGVMANNFPWAGRGGEGGREGWREMGGGF